MIDWMTEPKRWVIGLGENRDTGCVQESGPPVHVFGYAWLDLDLDLDLDVDVDVDLVLDCDTKRGRVRLSVALDVRYVCGAVWALRGMSVGQ